MCNFNAICCHSKKLRECIHSATTSTVTSKNSTMSPSSRETNLGCECNDTSIAASSKASRRNGYSLSSSASLPPSNSTKVLPQRLSKVPISMAANQRNAVLNRATNCTVDQGTTTPRDSYFLFERIINQAFPQRRNNLNCWNCCHCHCNCLRKMAARQRAELNSNNCSMQQEPAEVKPKEKPKRIMKYLREKKLKQVGQLEPRCYDTKALEKARLVESQAKSKPKRKIKRKVIVNQVTPEKEEGKDMWFECNVPLRVSIPTNICFGGAPWDLLQSMTNSLPANNNNLKALPEPNAKTKNLAKPDTKVTPPIATSHEVARQLCITIRPIGLAPNVCPPPASEPPENIHLPLKQAKRPQSLPPLAFCPPSRASSPDALPFLSGTPIYPVAKEFPPHVKKVPLRKKIETTKHKKLINEHSRDFSTRKGLDSCLGSCKNRGLSLESIRKDDTVRKTEDRKMCKKNCKRCKTRKLCHQSREANEEENGALPRIESKSLVNEDANSKDASSLREFETSLKLSKNPKLSQEYTRKCCELSLQEKKNKALEGQSQRIQENNLIMDNNRKKCQNCIHKNAELPLKATDEYIFQNGSESDNIQKEKKTNLEINKNKNECRAPCRKESELFLNDRKNREYSDESLLNSKTHKGQSQRILENNLIMDNNRKKCQNCIHKNADLPLKATNEYIFQNRSESENIQKEKKANLEINKNKNECRAPCRKESELFLNDRKSREYSDESLLNSKTHKYQYKCEKGTEISLNDNKIKNDKKSENLRGRKYCTRTNSDLSIKVSKKASETNSRINNNQKKFQDEEKISLVGSQISIDEDRKTDRQNSNVSDGRESEAKDKTKKEYDAQNTSTTNLRMSKNQKYENAETFSNKNADGKLRNNSSQKAFDTYLVRRDASKQISHKNSRDNLSIRSSRKDSRDLRKKYKEKDSRSDNPGALYKSVHSRVRGNISGKESKRYSLSKPKTQLIDRRYKADRKKSDATLRKKSGESPRPSQENNAIELTFRQKMQTFLSSFAPSLGVLSKISQTLKKHSATEANILSPNETMNRLVDTMNKQIDSLEKSFISQKSERSEVRQRSENQGSDLSHTSKSMIHQARDDAAETKDCFKGDQNLELNKSDTFMQSKRGSSKNSKESHNSRRGQDSSHKSKIIRSSENQLRSTAGRSQTNLKLNRVLSQFLNSFSELYNESLKQNKDKLNYIRGGDNQRRSRRSSDAQLNEERKSRAELHQNLIELIKKHNMRFDQNYERSRRTNQVPILNADESNLFEIVRSLPLSQQSDQWLEHDHATSDIDSRELTATRQKLREQQCRTSDDNAKAKIKNKYRNRKENKQEDLKICLLRQENDDSPPVLEEYNVAGFTRSHSSHPLQKGGKDNRYETLCSSRKWENLSAIDEKNMKVVLTDLQRFCKKNSINNDDRKPVVLVPFRPDSQHHGGVLGMCKPDEWRELKLSKCCKLENRTKKQPSESSNIFLKNKRLTGRYKSTPSRESKLQRSDFSSKRCQCSKRQSELIARKHCLLYRTDSEIPQPHQSGETKPSGSQRVSHSFQRNNREQSANNPSKSPENVARSSPTEETQQETQEKSAEYPEKGSTPRNDKGQLQSTPFKSPETRSLNAHASHSEERHSLTYSSHFMTSQSDQSTGPTSPSYDSVPSKVGSRISWNRAKQARYRSKSQKSKSSLRARRRSELLKSHSHRNDKRESFQEPQYFKFGIQPSSRTNRHQPEKRQSRQRNRSEQTKKTSRGGDKVNRFKDEHQVRRDHSRNQQTEPNYTADHNANRFNNDQRVRRDHSDSSPRNQHVEKSPSAAQNINRFKDEHQERRDLSSSSIRNQQSQSSSRSGKIKRNISFSSEQQVQHEDSKSQISHGKVQQMQKNSDEEERPYHQRPKSPACPGAHNLRNVEQSPSSRQRETHATIDDVKIIMKPRPLRSTSAEDLTALETTAAAPLCASIEHKGLEQDSLEYCDCIKNYRELKRQQELQLQEVFRQTNEAYERCLERQRQLQGTETIKCGLQQHGPKTNSCFEKMQQQQYIELHQRQVAQQQWHEAQQQLQRQLQQQQEQEKQRLRYQQQQQQHHIQVEEECNCRYRQQHSDSSQASAYMQQQKQSNHQYMQQQPSDVSQIAAYLHQQQQNHHQCILQQLQQQQQLEQQRQLQQQQQLQQFHNQQQLQQQQQQMQLQTETLCPCNNYMIASPQNALQARSYFTDSIAPALDIGDVSSSFYRQTLLKYGIPHLPSDYQPRQAHVCCAQCPCQCQQKQPQQHQQN
ncbi:trichohyalin-like isoform X2 [Drosophila albomicans]|uniref:Trichohyalin-like isoform X2 n=1 Tax=Drosophila albomicans TaxID=7291 RepID=A0A9C6WJA8_DROAB|nr:trichohyalin-like isoform X2 [Drosophila albomicans]